MKLTTIQTPKGHVTVSDEPITDYTCFVLINDKIIHKLKGIDDFYGYDVGLDGNFYKLNRIVAADASLNLEGIPQIKTSEK